MWKSTHLSNSYGHFYLCIRNRWQFQMKRTNFQNDFVCFEMNRISAMYHIQFGSHTLTTHRIHNSPRIFIHICSFIQIYACVCLFVCMSLCCDKSFVDLCIWCLLKIDPILSRNQLALISVCVHYIQHAKSSKSFTFSPHNPFSSLSIALSVALALALAFALALALALVLVLALALAIALVLAHVVSLSLSPSSMYHYRLKIWRSLILKYIHAKALKYSVSNSKLFSIVIRKFGIKFQNFNCITLNEAVLEMYLNKMLKERYDAHITHTRSNYRK